jgi:hypothetical protein
MDLIELNKNLCSYAMYPAVIHCIVTLHCLRCCENCISISCSSLSDNFHHAQDLWFTEVTNICNPILPLLVRQKFNSHPKDSDSSQHSEAVQACAGAWTLAETVFFLSRRWTYNRLNVLNPKRPQGDVRIRIAQFMSLKGVIDFKEFLSGWFMNAPFQELRRENVLDFVAYGFWCGPHTVAMAC